MIVIPFVESALEWKATRFQTFAMSLNESPKSPKVVRKIICHKTCEVNICKI